MISIGAVGYLNALPLVHTLDQRPGIRLVRRVPAALLADLEAGRLDIALCPVIDAQTSSRDLMIVPSGAIGSRSRTLTVRIFSRRPLDRIDHLHVDGDSHTSVALAQVIFHRRFARTLEISPLEDPAALDGPTDLEAALLIGDKVVTAEPNPIIFPHQLDLGQAWQDLTGLPFVFAAWLAPAEADLVDLPHALHKIRRDNCAHLEDLAGTWAREHGWPEESALTYLRDLLDYEIGPPQLKAMRLFWKECAELGIIDELKEIKIMGDGE
ncbi:MAG: menaquinone biosynthesis protein [Acidobacteriota bacterium]